MRVVITGGAGFIGSHIADDLTSAGHEVLIVDNLWKLGGGRRSNIPAGAAFEELDIRDPSLGRVFTEFKPEVVCHHAAQQSVAFGYHDPTFDADVNVMGLLNVLKSSVKAGSRKVIFASSGATFGDPETLPMNEETPQVPASPYGITKMVAEHYLRFFKAAHGLDFTALRYGNIFGPRQDPTGEAGIISIYIGKFLANQTVRMDWDGRQTRDYVYVSDIAALNALALDQGSGSLFVVGTGVRTSVIDIFEALCTITGSRPPIEYAPKRAGDLRDAQFDSRRVRAELGWIPKTSLLEGMRETYEFLKRSMPAY